MADPSAITRRTLLAWLGASTLTAQVLPALLRLAAASQSEDEALRKIVRVGRSYLKKVPDEANREKLAALLPSLKGSKRLAARIRALRDRVARDFAENRIVLLEGWLLSRTEARAAALVALGIEE